MVCSSWEQTKHVSATTYNCTIGSFWRMRLWWILDILHYVQRRFSLNTGSPFFSFKSSLPWFSFFLFCLFVCLSCCVFTLPYNAYSVLKTYWFTRFSSGLLLFFNHSALEKITEFSKYIQFKGFKQNKLAIKGEAQTKNRKEGLHFVWDPEVMRQL